MSASVELNIYHALKSAGVDDDKATAAAESITKAIDQRYALHADQLFTKRDGAELRAEVQSARADLMKAITDMQRWTIGTMIAAAALAVTIARILP